MSKATKMLMVSAMMLALLSGCVSPPTIGRVVTSFNAPASPSTIDIARALTHGLVPYGIEVDRVRDKLGVITLKTRYLQGANEAIATGDRRPRGHVYGVLLDTSIILHNGGMDILFTLRGDYRDENGVVHEDVHKQMIHLARTISQLTGMSGAVQLRPAVDIVAETQSTGQ